MNAASGPSRDPDFDVFPGFVSPPPGYGEVAFYWWLGDPLTKERLTWQLDQMAGWKISGLQVNYAHGTEGGRLWGLTYPSDPPLFSEAWWELYTWFQAEAERRGIAVSLSDYTLGSPGQGYYIDEILARHPEMAGSTLEPVTRADGSVGVRVQRHPQSLDPMHPRSGAEVIATFFQRFEDRLPGKAGTGLNYFFSDELNFGVSGNLWNESFAGEFLRRKGYDLVPLLAHVVADLDERTPKIRLDYRDVMVALEEENYFQPVYQWHEDRGMTYGCDHGGRGRDVLEFGDYFRTQKWNQAPGNDNPRLESDLIKNKVSSSIAHLYERPRTWLEGFYASGWGTSTEDLTDALNRNFVMGHNLVSLHGLYYSTHGGWWEWAPPCNHFRMPYAAHFNRLLARSERLSYLLSQGVHCCDVALLYPTATAEAGLGGDAAARTAFEVAQVLYDAGIDFDFVDAPSVDRAAVGSGRLAVASEEYRVLILPAMRALRHTTLVQAERFAASGGLVLAVGALPEATDRRGRHDPHVASLVRRLFSSGNPPVSSPGQVLDRLGGLDRDFLLLDQTDGTRSPWVLHRRIGPRHVYAVYGARPGRRLRFRSTGQVELWDSWTGTPTAWSGEVTSSGHTVLTLPGPPEDLHLVVFSPTPTVGARALPPTGGRRQLVSGPWHAETVPTRDNRWGDFALPAEPTVLGPEVHFLRQGGATVRVGFGARWEVLRPDAGPRWQPHIVSDRWGLPEDPGFQGYHGLKGELDGAVLSVGVPVFTPTGTRYEPTGGETRFRTWVVSAAKGWYRIEQGPLPPREVWLNAERVDGERSLFLDQGLNRLELVYEDPGRTWFVLEDTQVPLGTWQPVPLSQPWYTKPGVLRCDPYPQQPAEAYQFTAPPGLHAVDLLVHGVAALTVGDRPVRSRATGERRGARAWSFDWDEPVPAGTGITVTVHGNSGFHGGAVFEEPLRLRCREGRVELGDWAHYEGLSTYSGGLRYRTRLQTPASEHLTLDLGRVVATAEVWVDGEPKGVRVAPPWTFDLSGTAPGAHDLEVLVYNTLSNHYLTIPTRYRGNTESGLIGPVNLTW